MSSFAPITDVIHNAPWGKPRATAITGLWVHHQADGAGRADIDYMVDYNSRDSHPTYATDDSGRVHGIVHPDRSPASTGRAYDGNSVSVELANSGGAPDWPVTDAALEKLAHIIAHHANESPRRAHAIEVNDMGRTQSGFFVGWHSQAKATACPGPHVRDRIPQIVARANEILNGLRGGMPAATPSAPSVHATPTVPAQLDVDGNLGEKTIRRWQEVMGTGIDGVIDDTNSVLVRAVQTTLNAAGHRDWDGRPLVVDGDGIQRNGSSRIPRSGRTRTIWALQGALGTPQDGALDKGDSAVIRQLQRNLNEGRFL